MPGVYISPDRRAVQRFERARQQFQRTENHHQMKDKQPVRASAPGWPPRRSEFQEQSTLFQLADANRHTWPQLRKLYAVPNGEMRPQKMNVKTGKMYSPVGVKLKRQGVKRGVPDVVLPVARGGYFGLYIEMKADGGRQSDEQKQWEGWLQEEGYKVEVCVGVDAAWEVLKQYLGTRPTRVDSSCFTQ